VGLCQSFSKRSQPDWGHWSGSDLSQDRNAFGGDWQVHPSEPQLFSSTPEGFPQAPHATCKLPDVDAHEYLRSENADTYRIAVEACQKEGMVGLDLDDCVFDVMILNNPGVAAAWWGSKIEEED